MSAKVDRIIIVGGGIGGLATALALQQRGYAVRVYERAREMREIGAGVVVAPNARRALKNLGIDEELKRISFHGHALHICNYATGEVIRCIPGPAVEDDHHLGVLQVHRGDLHSLLIQAVRQNDPDALRPGHTFETLEQDADGVTVTFANGESDRADVVIGADGNASAVRSFLFPGEPPVFNGQIAFRALTPRDRVPAAILERPVGMYGAPGRYLLHYPLRGGSLMNVIGVGQASSWQEEGWSIPATNAEFEAHYSDLAPELLELIRNIPEGELFKWGLRDREPLGSWTVGRVTVLGDAAHPMTPFLGQGACLAIEDALVLGRAFAESEAVDEALDRYEAARRPRGTNVQIWSREQGEALQDPQRRWRSPEDLGLTEYDPVTVPV
jgi:salicylate hydroxylase